MFLIFYKNIEVLVKLQMKCLHFWKV